MRPIVGIVLLAGVAAASVQKSFSAPSFEAEEDYYQFDWPIRKIAVIGAGPRYLCLVHSIIPHTYLLVVV